MKIAMTGGGSGGHITPLLAVAHEIKQQHANTDIIYIGQTGDDFGTIVAEHALFDQVYSVQAGKFRRYHGEGWRQLLDFETLWLNLRDTLRVVVGFFQSLILLRRLRPDVLFCKGGFVGVPVGLAAALLRIPYITHDSDAIPGLANRIISRWAVKHAVALDTKLYPYPAAKTVNVGVPVSAGYHIVDATERAAYRKQLGLEKFTSMVLVTGGGLGAQRVNEALVTISPDLLAHNPGLCVVHTAGKKHEAEVSAAYSKMLPSDLRSRVIVRDYLNDLHVYSGAADVVVARGGATNFAELAAQAKAAVIVPNPLLTGGHQLKNAAAYAEKGAILVVSEADIVSHPEVLGQAISGLLINPGKRAELETNIHAFARPDAAKDLADLVVALGATKA